jgi:phospholipase C
MLRFRREENIRMDSNHLTDARFGRRTSYYFGKLLWLVLITATLTTAQVSTGVPNSSSAYNTPIQHVIVIIQENRSPTNLFQDPILINNGAHIVQTGLCHGQPVPLKPWSLAACFEISHTHAQAWVPSYDNGMMDGACDIENSYQDTCQTPLCPNSTAHCAAYTYTPNTKFDGVHGIMDPYYQVAEQYGFANYMFQTNQGPSFPAHMFLFAGTSAPTTFPDDYYDWFAAENPQTPLDGAVGCPANPSNFALQIDPNGVESKGYNNGFPCYDNHSLPDLLASVTPNITWRYYGTPPAYSYLNAPDAIQSICQAAGDNCAGPDWTNGDVVINPPQVLTDIQQCQLPQVNWVIPDGHWSDHPGGGPQSDAGPSWIAAIVNALGSSSCPSPAANWNNTAILITWDDWGGFYDDVDPAQHVGLGYKNGNGNGQQYVYGFRVPLLVVSAYTKQTMRGTASPFTGYISNANHDFGSILNFIEYVFGHNGKSIGTIGPPDWPFADYFAPDAPPTDLASPYGLSDFFNFGQSHPFRQITGARYAPSCFFNPESCFENFPMAPDNDAFGAKRDDD